MDDQSVAMGQNLVAATGSKAGGAADNRHRRVFQRADSFLEAVEKFVDLVPVLRLDIGAEGVQVDACREMLRVVVDDDALAVVLPK